MSVRSVHLYYLFPSLEEGGLATYRTAIVQNQHLAMLAKVNDTSPLRVGENTESSCQDGVIVFCLVVMTWLLSKGTLGKSVILSSWHPHPYVVVFFTPSGL